MEKWRDYHVPTSGHRRPKQAWSEQGKLLYSDEHVNQEVYQVTACYFCTTTASMSCSTSQFSTQRFNIDANVLMILIFVDERENNCAVVDCLSYGGDARNKQQGGVGIRR